MTSFSSSTTDGGTWSSWVGTDTATTATGSTSGTWYTWIRCDSTATSGTSTGDTTWVRWTTAAEIHDRNYGEGSIDRQEEQRRYRAGAAQEALERRERAATQQKEKEKAEIRAKDLLLDLIGEKELAVYNETGRLFVKGKKFDYIIQKSGFIKKISKEKITDLCVHLNNRYSFPETDNVIAMKLAIESDESGLLKLANDHGSVARPRELLKAACM